MIKCVILDRVDVRGSGFSGDSTRSSVHRRLGELETRDLRHVIRSVRAAKTGSNISIRSVIPLDDII